MSPRVSAELREQYLDKRRNQILDAALVIFSQKGFDAASTLEIARRAGVAQGTIFNYFQNKKELFIAVIKNLIITVPLLEEIKKSPGSEFTLNFKNILQNRLGSLEGDNLAHLSSLMGEIQRDPELKVLFREKFIQPFLAQMESTYHSMMSTGKLRKIESSIVVRLVGGLIIGFTMLKMIESEASPLNQLPQEKITQEILEFILHGLLKEKD